MGEQARLVGVRQVKPGGASPMASAPKGMPALRACRERWAHLPVPATWTAFPTDMLADHVGAALADVRAIYGEGAAQKTLTSLCFVVARHTRPLKLTAAWTGSTARMTLNIHREKTSPDPAPVGVEFELEAPEGASEEDFRSSLAQFGSARQPPAPRLTFDPLTQLPAADLRALMAQIEPLCSEPRDADALFGTVGFLMCWARCEEMNVGRTTMRLSGLSDGDDEICPGESIVFTGVCQSLEPAPPPKNESPPKDRATIRWRPS